MTDGNDKQTTPKPSSGQSPQPTPPDLSKLPGGLRKRHLDHVYEEGNPDAQILAKAFELYAKDGLTLEERTKIEKLDAILKDANISISNKADLAIIEQKNGAIFNITPKGRGR